ncbi:MAG TPA: hypothetical protein VFA43_03210 [Gemmatimonadaceae bacterium]|nr:hypothetical protein [Gemmatimonadaceae bacterium]
MRAIYVTALLFFVLTQTACTGGGCEGGGGGNLQGGGNGLNDYQADHSWKTDIPSELKDSSSTYTVNVVIQFASAFTSADSMEVVSTGGTVTATNIPPSTDFIMATYPNAKLQALASSYTGSRIVGLDWNYFGGKKLSGSPTGC